PWPEWTRRLLAVRHRHIVPRLDGAHAIGAEALGAGAVAARWRRGDGTVLGILANLVDTPAPLSANAAASLRDGTLRFETASAASEAATGQLPPHALIAVLEPAR
ncbi:MAG: DUF3459 domain-containing protein, partial [Burkholderiaceae bacterium]